MELLSMVIRNQLFHRRKVLPVFFLAGVLMFLPAATVFLIGHIKGLADRPLQSLGTELILQSESVGKPHDGLKTRGVIQPFNLNPFPKEAAAKLKSIGDVSGYSTALVLWQLNTKNNLTIVALDSGEPLTGLRKIEAFLMPGSLFFSGNEAHEAVLERHFAKLFGYKKGGEIVIGETSLRIVGIVDFKEQSNLSNAQIFIPYETGLRLSGAAGPVINQIFISLKSAKNIKTVTPEIEALFPGCSLITKDSLFKNLSGFNRMVYSSGRYLIMAVVPLSCLLLFWTIRLHSLEFGEQTTIMRTLGWPPGMVRRWVLLDTGLVLAGGFLLAAILTILLQWQILTLFAIAPLLDQGLKL